MCIRLLAILLASCSIGEQGINRRQFKAWPVAAARSSGAETFGRGRNTEDHEGKAQDTNEAHPQHRLDDSYIERSNLSIRIEQIDDERYLRQRSFIVHP
jgi:hypothetical protein